MAPDLGLEDRVEPSRVRFVVPGREFLDALEPHGPGARLLVPEVAVEDDGRASHAGEARGGDDRGGGLPEQRGEHGVPTAVVLVRRVPHDVPFPQPPGRLAQLVAFDHRAVVAPSATDHEPLDDRVAVAAVHDVERHAGREEGAGQVEGEEVGPGEEDAASLRLCLEQVIQAVTLEAVGHRVDGAEPGLDRLHEPDAGRLERPPHEAGAFPGRKLRKAQVDIRVRDAPTTSAGPPGEAPETASEGGLPGHREPAREPRDPDADPEGPVAWRREL